MLTHLIGTWNLQSFDILDNGGQKTTWGKNLRGLLIYAPDGSMSVGINREIDELEADMAQESLDSILFYAGDYTVDNDQIFHRVQVASNPSRIGKTIVRFATLEGDVLTLTGPKEAFGTAILSWKRTK